MILRNRMKDPSAVMSIGMLCLVLAICWQRFLPLTAGLGPEVLFGVSIGMNLWSLRLAARQRRCGES
jgi:hypothetical protein